MKREKFIRTVALLLCAVLVFGITIGCTTKQDDKSTVSEIEDDDFVLDDDDAVYEGGGDDKSTKTQGDKKETKNDVKKPTTTAKKATGGGADYGLDYTDNTEIFKNIPKEYKGKTVLFADWGEASADRYQLVVKKFTEETGIKVKMLLYNESDFISNVAKQIAAGSSPDIVACNSTFPQALEVVQELPSIFNVNDGFWDSRVTEATMVGGKKYFVNTYNSPFTGGYVVYYNKRIFNNNGITSPEDYYKAGKWTYENLFKAMQDVKKAGFNGGIIECMTLAGQMGKSLINYDKSTGTFKGMATDEDLIAALQFMAKAVDEGLAGGYGITDFASGQVGICMAGTYGLKYNGYFKDMSPTDIGVVPLPNSYQGKKLELMPLGYRGYGICKGAKNPGPAYYFLRYYLDLDKYEPAGANIFANKVLEKYFRQTQLVLFQKSKLFFEYYQGALNLAGHGWSTSEWAAVRHAPVNQVAVELKARENITNNAAALATEKLKEFAKK